MQLNMGEGKSSVIIPMVASALANGSELVRVIVAKAQAKQMFQMLISKLGGFLGRRVYRLPFSRQLKLSASEADEVGRLCRECITSRGVLLIQPEQMLPILLMALYSLIANKDEVGRSLMRTLDLFQLSSRDLVDESDENYSEKFELVYTIGTQKGVEFSPERWVMIQEVLGFIRSLLPEIEGQFPSQVEPPASRPGEFPRTRIHGAEAQKMLLSKLAKHICTNGLGGLPIARQPQAARSAILA